MKTWRRLVVGGGFVALALVGDAEPYSLESSTLDGGGGTSSGGSFTLTGTIGQPDAGTSTGAGFALEGGFWPALALPALDAPVLLIQLVGDAVTLSWSPAIPGFTLEMADELAVSAWVSAPVGNPVTLAIPGGARFYRLHRP